LCHISSGFHVSEFCNDSFLQSKVVSLSSNPQHWGPGPCIYVPQWQDVITYILVLLVYFYGIISSSSCRELAFKPSKWTGNRDNDIRGVSKRALQLWKSI
jgi:hypothetical protein